MITRVIDALTYDQAPGLRTMYVAEYLTRTCRAEISALVRSKRRLRSKTARGGKVS